MQNGVGSSYNLEIFVTTARTTSVSVTVTSPRYSNPTISQSFSITAGQVTKVLINNNYRMIGTGKSTKGIQITATDEVIVYGVNREYYTADAFLALPTDVLGTEYYAHAWYPATTGRHLQMLVVGASDSTHIGIRLANKNFVNVTYSGVNYIKNDWLNMTINKYDTLQLQTIGDITGSLIVADKPIVAYSGNQETNIASSNTGYTDYIVEQLVPVPNWGKTFAIVPIPGRSTGDYYRLIASQDSTTIEVNGQTSGTPFTETISITTKGDFSQKLYSSQLYASLTADKPIMVVQYVYSQINSEYTDPSMMIIPPIEQYTADYTFTTITSASYTNYFMFVVKSSDKSGIRINGAAFPGNTVYNTIPGTTYEGGYLQLSDGTYTVRHTSPLSIFGGVLYGRRYRESFALRTGMRLAAINAVTIY